MSLVVLDSGAVSFLSSARPAALQVLRAIRPFGELVVPSIVLTECLTETPADTNAHRLLKTCRIIESVPVTLARRAARLRVAAGRGSAVDALVVALGVDGTVVTGDEGDIRALAANHPVSIVPI